MFAPPAGFPQPGSLTSPSCRNPFCYGYLCLCNAQMFISIYFLKVSFKKEQGASSSSFNHNTRSRFGLYCFLRRTSRFSTMQHFKVLLLLLFVAAVSISLTQAWLVNNQKVGKRKQVLSFSCSNLFSPELSSAEDRFLENCISELTQNTTATATRTSPNKRFYE